MVISFDKIEDIISILYAKDYQLLQLTGYYKGNYEKSVIAFGVDNDEIRKDLIFLLNHFHQESGIVKYFDETSAKKVFADGSEIPLGIVLYNTDSDNMSYIHNGLSFSFVEQTRYWVPKIKDDFKIGMIVEYFNNNKWYKKSVEDPSIEYDKMYKLMIKYNKIRICQ